jgi:hypothetical protein
VPSRLSRHLESLIYETRDRRTDVPRTRLLTGAPEQPRRVLPPELSWRDYSVMLLHVAAEIEHSLMVEYLFAAYSLGGPQVPSRLRKTVRKWQEIILGVAKEEMGHLMTVQNVLTALGAPLNLNRENYPWDIGLYPFPFTLEPPTLGSIAKYVLAESAPNWSDPPAAEIKQRAGAAAHAVVNHVGSLYALLIEILGRTDLIAESAFQPRTLSLQSSWDTWGRGYTRGQRGVESGNVPGALSPELIILRVISRDTAIFALRQVGEQGEGVGDPAASAGEESHFRRFLTIWIEMQQLSSADLKQVSQPVADNPCTSQMMDDGSERYGKGKPSKNWISNPVALAWGHLFNLRYRMLLINLAHSMRPVTPQRDATPTVDRGILINRTFAEMYNLRVIASTLVQLPLDAADPNGLHAGPPFEMPYTLDIPERESDRWLLQRDLLQAARIAIEELKPMASSDGLRFLIALNNTDQLATLRVDGILSNRPVMTLDEDPK